MPDLQLPSENGFRPGEETIDSAMLNRMLQACLRQLRGDGKYIQVRKFGDRVIISFTPQPTPTPKPVFIKTFVVVQVGDDYLVCAPFNYGDQPHIHNPNTGVGEENLVVVAKPRLLQRTPFDGQQVVKNGQMIEYSYQGASRRQATISGSEDEEDTETQEITEDYFTGDIITAHKGLTGISINGVKIEWTDLNTGGRQWARVEEEE